MIETVQGVPQPRRPQTRPAARPAPAVTDVRPLSVGTLLATCECGLESTTSTADDGWTWAIDHPCAQPAR